MSSGVILRSIAIAIAIAALVDPSITRDTSRREVVTVVAMDDASVVAANALRERLGDDVEATTWVHDRSSTAAACPAAGGCVIVSSGDAPDRATAGARILGGLKVRGFDRRAEDGDVAAHVLTRLDAPIRTHRDATAMLGVHTNRVVQRIEIFDGDTLVGSADPKGQSAVDVPWVPLAEGARALRVVADGDIADVGVVVDASPAPVLFYEPQATWLGTFVRRALEDDPRFALVGRARIAPPITVSRGDAALSATTLETVGAAIVTAPELLSASDVGLLERFVTHRGGSLIVVSDRRPTGAALRLMPRVASERRDVEPQTVGLLRASEWLAFEPAIGVETIASVNQQPVVVARAIGRGRVVVSGALDAWRFRHANDGFNTFWTTLAWDAAMAAGPRLRVVTDRTIARPGEELRVGVEHQGLTPASLTPVASGNVQCGDQRNVLRLWPGARAGTFTAAFRVDREGACTITVTVGEVSGSAPVTIRDDLRRLPQDHTRLDALLAAHGGVLVGADGQEQLVSHVRAALTSRNEPREFRPMHSAYWLIPFVFCLGGEWWLRRRSGLS